MPLAFFTLLSFILIGIPVAVTIGILVIIKKNENKSQPSQFQQYTYAPVNVKPPKPKKKMSASAVMLLIGTIFVILSAITFVAANWVKMEPAGRVFALAGAAVLAFAVSGVMKATGLVRTSAAFYIIGSLLVVTSAAAAGYYTLFGDWFSMNGNGAGMFFASMMLLAAAASFFGNSIYKTAVFHYIGLSFISAAIMFVCVQLTDNFEQFAPTIAAAQLIITAVIHMFKLCKGTALEKPVRIVGDITAILFELTSLSYVVSVTFETTWYALAVLGIILVQLFAYGIFKNQKWMFIFANIFTVYCAFTAAVKLGSEYGSDFAMLSFGFIMLIVYVINIVIPKNITIAKNIAFAGAFIGAVVSLLADNAEYFGLNLIVPAAVSLKIIISGLSKSRDMQIFAGLSAPVMPFFMALFLNSKISDLFGSEESKVLVYGGLALVYIAVAAFYIYLPKIAFNIHAHHSDRSQLMSYTTMTAAAFTLMGLAKYSQLFIIPVALCVLHFVVSRSMKCNITAAGSVIASVMLTSSVIHHYCKDSAVGMYIMFGLFVLLIAASRFVFPESFICKKSEKTTVDVLLLSSWTSLIHVSIFDRTGRFLLLMAAAIIAAGFVKRNTPKDAAAVLFSVSAFFAAIAAMTRPFLNPDSSMITSKITLAIMAALGIAYKYIWRNHKTASKTVSTVIFVLTFAGLIFDGLIYSNLLNRIFVLCITAALLIFSFFVKSKTWFSASSIALVIMTVVSTKKYFDAAGWWIYLLAVGIIFIAIAAINEALKKKGETMKSTVTKTFSDWTW